MSNTEKYQPPFTINNKIINLTSEISGLVSEIKIKNGNHDDLRLRRENRIKSIQSSLAIENNTLSVEQITAILNGKRVLAPQRDIQEAENAIKAYDLLPELDPYSIDDLRKAHLAMGFAVVEEAGNFRSSGVGIINPKTGEVKHMAPPANMVYELVSNLLSWLHFTDFHPLIASSIFHYEFEFIHPFTDGNGRTGRLWQTLILSKWQSVFSWIPIETIIREHQNEYYEKIQQSTRENEIAFFVEYMLLTIKTAIEKMISDYDDDYESDYVNKLMQVLGDRELSTPQLMGLLNLSHATNFRKNYLLPALEKKLIERTVPDKPKSKNQKYRKVRK